MHHHRRKSGHTSTNSSMTDVRKSGVAADSSRSRRPQTLARKSTPQTLQKLGKSPRDREREWVEEQWVEDERESFPQFCMTCEKQFIAQDERFLYCSEACRRHDQNVTTSSHPSVGIYGGYGSASLPFYTSGNPEPRDIVPRASPSRPSSTYFSPPTTPTSSQYTSAVSALRSLNQRPPSPPSPVSMSSGIWPFTRSAATSPGSSYTQAPGVYPSTYDGAYQASTYSYAGSGMVASDRPLPTRNPSAYSRPQSIELVTPMISRY
ncbi:putative life-span regulatory factor [Rosellinia necatrix]|uniref:Putative life-span regulatory factor n=1 Tax=Rosellinia necatrix TaxID=77044 RepID=A0A1W2TMX7_ROSNE|nr:putative life-span regulatory factor [Rosellinia necatrix]